MVLIGAYGMFWYRGEVDFELTEGATTWDMLGRRGMNAPTMRTVDFRRARGVYVLFDDYGAYYVGLARGKGGLGGRLRDHTRDKHAENWSRFCWFSFDGVADEKDDRGLHLVEARDQPVPGDAESVIRELEALLITILNTRNTNTMRFQDAEPWEQVEWHERTKWLAKVSPHA